MLSHLHSTFREACEQNYTNFLMKTIINDLWFYWVGFILGYFILIPFGMENIGVLVGLLLGSMVQPIHNKIKEENE